MFSLKAIKKYIMAFMAIKFDWHPQESQMLVGKYIWQCIILNSLQSVVNDPKFNCRRHVSICRYTSPHNSDTISGPAGPHLTYHLINCASKDIIIGNIYHPPHDNNNKESISTFISELDSILSSTNATRRDIIISGNFNINLLHINICNKEHYGSFIDLMVAYSLIPKITLPTKIAENSCS